ncbi:MAG: PDZ domain-containing protein, partial [Candidatus Omnitrophica bacterium]|nr:PDZ domain-containing protein [Candidatus Omnitrophota bacterium]
MHKNILIGFLLAVLLFTGVTGVDSANKKKNHDDLYRQVELFSDTLAIIHNEYVDDTKPKDLIYGALKGMLASLDAHSQFMDPETYNELKVDTQGKFGGLGIEITIKDGLLTVITPIEDTPAWKAGIKANDRIVKINDELTREMTLMDAVKKMRGQPG